MAPKSINIATIFLLGTGIVFWSGIIVPDALESFDMANSLTASTGVANDPVAFQVYSVYCQVIGSLCLIYAGFNIFPGHNGILFSAIIMAITCTKHWFIDSLMPPMHVIVMTLVNFVMSVRARFNPGEKRRTSKGKGVKVKENEQSAQKWCLIFHAVTAMAFTYDPVSPLLGTFPDIKPGSPLFVLAITEIETIALFAFAITVNIVARPSFSMFTATFSLFPFLIYKHITVEGASPSHEGGYVWAALSLWLMKDSFTMPRPPAPEEVENEEKLKGQ